MDVGSGLVEAMKERQFDPNTIRKAVNVFGPFFEIAKTGEYPLDPLEKVDATQMSIALFHFIYEEISRVELVSLREITEYHFMGASNPVLVSDHPEFRWVEDVVAINVGVALGHALYTTLRSYLSETRNGKQFNLLWSAMSFNIHVLLVDTLLSIVNGDEQKLARTLPMLRMIRKAIPLSRLANEPKVWVVIAR